VGIAMMSDIHSNIYALSEVIANAKIHQVDVMVNLVDLLNLGQL
jgi:Icc-related predicted phosphoesterase